MEVQELKNAMLELVHQGYSQVEIADGCTRMFVRREIPKDFYIACLHLIGITTEKMDNIEEEKLRTQLREALEADMKQGGQSGKKDKAAENNEKAKSSAEGDEADRLFGLNKK